MLKGFLSSILDCVCSHTVERNGMETRFLSDYYTLCRERFYIQNIMFLVSKLVVENQTLCLKTPKIDGKIVSQ